MSVKTRGDGNNANMIQDAFCGGFGVGGEAKKGERQDQLTLSRL